MRRLSTGRTVETSVRMPQALAGSVRAAAGGRTFSEYVREVLEAHFAGLAAAAASPFPDEPEAELLASSTEDAPVAERTLAPADDDLPREEF